MKKIAYLLFICLFACSQSETLPEKDVVEVNREPSAEHSSNPQHQETEGPEYDTWSFDRVDRNSLVFKEGPIFETKLYELEYIGQIDIDRKAPFLIFSGRYCDECDANISVYFHSLRNGYLNVNHGENRYQYPGMERDYETDSLLYQARAFFGEVFDGVKGMVWFQTTLMEDNSLQNSIYLAKIDSEKVVAEEVKNFDKRLSETLQLNRAGKNKEIKGREFTSEP